MALERRNINIPISGGENQGEDSYLLKPPFLKVTNGFYKKDGSIKKRGAYQFLTDNLGGQALPFSVDGVLHAISRSSLLRWSDPSTSTTQSLGAHAEFVPTDVFSVGVTSDGAREVVSAQGQFETVVVWQQPVPPDPDGAVTDRVFELYACAYRNEDLKTPIRGPFRLLEGSTPQEMTEIGLLFSGGWFCLYGIRQSDGLPRYSIFQTLTQTLNFSNIGLSAAAYIDGSVPGNAGTSFYFVVQNQSDSSNATASLRTWGNTVGYVGSVSGSSLSFSSSVLGTVSGSPDYVGDFGVAIYAEPASPNRLYFAVASIRTDTVKVFHTNASLGAKSSAVTVVTHSADTPWVTGAYGQVLDSFYSGRYPAFRASGPVDTSFRCGRIALTGRASSVGTGGVTVFWSGPIINDTGILVGDELFAPYQAFNPTLCGIGWKTVDGSLVVSGTTGFASCSWLHSKPVVFQGRVYATFAMSTLNEHLDDFSTFYVSSSNASFPSRENRSTLAESGVRDAAWKMGQLCQIGEEEATPVSQFGADLLTDFAWCLQDVNLGNLTRGSNEQPSISSRPPVPLFVSYDESSLLSTGTYLSRPDVVETQSPWGDLRLDANRLRPVLFRMQFGKSPRSSVARYQDKVLLGNGWLSVLDSSGIREAAPNFIPPTPTGRYSSTTPAVGNDSIMQVSWLVVEGENSVYRSSLSGELTFDGDNGASPGRPMDRVVVANQPPSISKTNARVRFEVWSNQTLFDPTSPVVRMAVYEPSALSASGGPWRYEVDALDSSDATVRPTYSSSLQPEPVGGCSYVTTTSNRVWYIEPEEKGRVRFSKDFSVLGRLEFNRNLYIDIPDGSRPVAVASLDEQVVIFTDRSIFLVTGNLPNNAGGGSNFYLQKVAFEEGCTNRYSILESRVGIFFESKRGINLLTRGYEVVSVGSPVGDSVEDGNSITGTCHLPSEDLFCFTTDTKILVCHESGGQFRWTEWLFEHDGDIVASCAWGDHHVVLDSDGSLWYMDFANVTDVVLSFTTPWLYFGDLEGFQRIRDINLVGRNDTSSMSVAGSCAVQVGYDFSESFSETAYYEYGPSLGTSPMRIRFKPGRQKSSSFRLKFGEVAETIGQSTTLNADVTIAGISVEVGVKAMGNKTARNTPTTPS